MLTLSNPSAKNRTDRSHVRFSLSNSTLLPPFIRFREEFLVNPDYHLATCQIEKVMTTVREGIFCYLTDPRNFSIHNRTISKEHWKNRYCDFQNYLNNYTIVKYAKGKKGIARLAEQFDSIFKRAYVPDTLREVIRDELLKGSTSHSTHSSEESRHLREAFFADPSLVRKVVQIYFYDFIIFDFPFPQLP
ncbi:hypothetical protein ANCCAN_26212 [Ancylostoma caninum]|uniref:Uncharacterized protein n=1 Tax=Ancylostoma caninum TaxID=29170 RepID=A0A368F7L4_ANCCA|nr:hypothetical protein ANCCAN_26212 [Ancylostoma caninum]